MTNSKLLLKLAEMMPKSKDEPSDGSMMRSFRDEPIRRHAEYFAHALDYDLPADREELIALLWVFGEAVSGETQKRAEYYLKLATDMQRLLPPLPFVIPKEPGA